MLRAVLRFSLIWILSAFAAPYVRRVFDRVARRGPEGSILESVLLELSANYSGVLVRVVAAKLAAVMLESGRLIFVLVGAVRPATRLPLVGPLPGRRPGRLAWHGRLPGSHKLGQVVTDEVDRGPSQ